MPMTFSLEPPSRTRAKCKKCSALFAADQPRFKMFQAAARTGSAFVLMQWHATCVPEGTAQRANRADQAVYQQLKAAQEEERHKQSAASAEAERKKQQSGMRRYFGSGGSGSKA